MLFRVLIGLAALGCSVGITADDQQQELTVTTLSENVFLLTGERVGANVGVVISKDKVLLIDTIVSKHSDKLIKAVKKLTQQPVTHIINTHGDFDHTGVNEHYRAQGALVIGQSHIVHSKVQCDLCFEDNLSFSLSDEIQVTMQSAVAHSFSDNIIYIKAANVVFMGDILTNLSHPTFYQGGMAGFEAAIDYALNLGNEQTQYIAGHGFIINKTQLQTYLSVTKEIVNSVVLLHGKGNSVEDIVESTEFKLHYSNLENKVRLEDTNPNRLKRFIERIVATEVSASSEVKLEKYAGHYLWSDETPFQLELRDNKLLYKESGQRIIELIPVNQEKFLPRGQSNWHYRFSFDKSGSVDSMSYVSHDNSSSIAKPVQR